MGFLSNEEIKALGFKSVGTCVKISDKCSIYAPQNISIGNNVRIDDFCILSAHGSKGSLIIGNNIHIAAYVGIFAGAGINLGNFSTISSKSTLYSTSDDYSGDFLIGPVIPDKYLNVDTRPIRMEEYSQIGAHSIVLPGVTMKQGSVLGAMSLANKGLDPWTIYGGIPAKPIKKRQTGLIEKADQLTQDQLEKNTDSCES